MPRKSFIAVHGYQLVSQHRSNQPNDDATDPRKFSGGAALFADQNTGRKNQAEERREGGGGSQNRRQRGRSGKPRRNPDVSVSPSGQGRRKGPRQGGGGNRRPVRSA